MQDDRELRCQGVTSYLTQHRYGNGRLPRSLDRRQITILAKSLGRKIILAYVHPVVSHLASAIPIHQTLFELLEEVV